MNLKKTADKIIIAAAVLLMLGSYAGASPDEDRLINFADGLYKEKKYDEALQIYEELLKLSFEMPRDAISSNYHSFFLR